MKDRKAEALAAAQACAELLKTRFGARRVIVFGSLIGQGPWHVCSDIDLAVEGLADEAFFAAYSACCDLLPPGLKLDLVPLEDAYPEMRARILGEVEMPKDPVLALKGLIEDELIALERVAQEMEDLLAVCAQPPTRTELRAMASMLHEFYNGVERIFQRIAIRLGEGVPRGEYWHVDLLNQMAEEREGVRPAVIEGPLRDTLEEYLRFRHFFRHAYGYTLEWVKIRPLAEGMAEALEKLRAQLMAFLESMVECIDPERSTP
ncbi:MAG: nucleotidyltransferase domain-containing protein [Chloroflexota bacterium]|nr:nucleotidyltransferase domain-containing protein [Chloroflexota bacterium]